MPLATKGTTVPEQPPKAVQYEDLVLVPAEAAPIAHLSERTIVRLCANGTIKAVKLGKSWRINKPAFLQLFGIAE